MSFRSEITRELISLSSGDVRAADRLFPMIYDELRGLAGRFFGDEPGDHTLQPTALVHEAYIRLIDQRQVTWQNRAHFFGLAARAMRRILVDHARGRRALKRGGDRRKLVFEESQVPVGHRDDYLVALDQALNALSELDPQLARIVELRFFGGLTNDEAAEVLGLSSRTVKRYWVLAKSRLHQTIAENA